ncbi:unnamed protein product [Bursaphelenchus okinawaensis]|uniref:RNA helicase n=1 Tax=Bursaphelenchus okinawaensis TaxID=465554 RepID=A0A811KJB6_9BILA|nr:unnamed protein product [Bursaphelenchus okinawaensis]CAG9103992.1 unnamed protein product [Bursaphelenchus okinawaensis]
MLNSNVLLRTRQCFCVNFARPLSITTLHSSKNRNYRQKFKVPSAFKKVPIVNKTVEDLVSPVEVRVRQTSSRVSNFEKEAGIKRQDVSSILDKFCRRAEVREQAGVNGINDKLFMRCFSVFRDRCLDPTQRGPALEVLLNDIKDHGHSVDLLFPQFLEHSKRVFPHLEALEELKHISDLTQPHTWYEGTRSIYRKIIFHAGPTNSGKTYNALKAFREADTAVYCGPLRLLATEVFRKSNELGVDCDLATGDDRQFANSNHEPAKHLSCTVEMLSLDMQVDVAVIDEIQMLRDDQRGWAWTRALLGVCAKEVHVCGEPAALDIVCKVLDPIGEHVDVRTYERKSPYYVSNHALKTIENVQDGDCIVCFSRKNILAVTRQLERRSIPCAVIYGAMPPQTKLDQAARFNDPDDGTNVLVATDAIGMGLNLNIKRIIFFSLSKGILLIPNYHALQIAGRAGRYGTQYAVGKVTTFFERDLGLLKDVLDQPVIPIQQVGIAPTFEQFELFAYHLPKASFVNLLDIFVSLCLVSDDYFLCNTEDIRELAVLIDNIPLELAVRFNFCKVPLKVKGPLGTYFQKMARRYSSGFPLTEDWMAQMIEWPAKPAETLNDILSLEYMYEILTAYVWLGLRYEHMFPDVDVVKQWSTEVADLIGDGIQRLISCQPEKQSRVTSEEFPDDDS